MKIQKKHPLLLLPFFLAFLLIPSLVTGQDKTCGTKGFSDYTPIRKSSPGNYQSFLRDFTQNRQNRSSSSNCLNYAPIKAHIIRRSDGTGGLTEAELNSAIATMNTFYANACMAFYLCDGINYIDDDTYYDFHTDDEGALTSANNVVDLINIYFANSITNGSSFYCGYAYYPGGPDVVLMDNGCTTNGSTLSHELGHFFSLPHTHNGGDELVNGSNCTTAGDEFCDTPADPNLSGNVDSSCNYTGTDTDANGDSYLPNTRNVMSYSRKACRTEFSTEQYAAISYSFLNERNYWNCLGYNVDFTANVTESCNSSLTVNFTELATGETSYEWDFDNDGVVDATDANPTYTYSAAGSYDVKLTVSNGTFTISKLKTAYINLGSNPYPYAQAMESWIPATNATGYDDGWVASPTDVSSGYRWNVSTGSTPSNFTGPDGDHTTTNGTGVYVFTEATGSSVGDVAELVSPCIDVPVTFASSDYSIRFWYHMYGSSMGTLHIDLFDGTNWINDITPAISGQQHNGHDDPFSEKIFSVAAYQGQSIQIRFRGVRGGGYTSDIAIDDFEIFDNVAPLPIELLNFTGKNLDNGGHLLNWSTASEQNADYFEVEFSADGQRFETLDKVSATGTSITQQDYSFTHAIPQPGLTFYRLKMVDWDESFSYSNIIQLETSRRNEGLVIFPNPGKGQYQLELGSNLSQVNFQVFNAVGQIIRQGQWDPRDATLSLDLSDVANGVYLVRIEDSGRTIELQRLIKK